MTSAAPAGIQAAARFLEQHDIRFEVVEHRETYTAAAEARASARPPEATAKTIALRDGAGAWRLAVIPASERLHIGKLREVLDAGSDLRLAAENELAEEFPDFELGAIPPFGGAQPTLEVLDRRLTACDQILCSGGDHRHGVLVSPDDVVRVTGAAVADICRD